MIGRQIYLWQLDIEQAVEDELDLDEELYHDEEDEDVEEEEWDEDNDLDAL